MSDAVIVTALLAIATGLALGRVDARLAIVMAHFIGAAALMILAPLPQASAYDIAVAAGLSTIIAALAVYWPRHLPLLAALCLAVNAGIWCGAVARTIDPPLALASLSGVMVALPARWMARSSIEWPGIMLKILAGWAIAIATLTTALPLLMTPGSQSDHFN